VVEKLTFNVGPKKKVGISHLFLFFIYLYNKKFDMKNKFILTEEESKRILSLHKQKIQEEQNQFNEQEEDLDEDKGQSTGRVAAGGGIGATAGAKAAIEAAGGSLA
jgi:hypothetical protein